MKTNKTKKTSVIYRINNSIFDIPFKNEDYALNFCREKRKEFDLIWKEHVFDVIYIHKMNKKHRYIINGIKTNKNNTKNHFIILADSKKKANFIKKLIEEENLNYEMTIEKFY